jgi:hypothetical protein
MMGSNNSMMLQSVMNTVNNMPAYLQRHIDERMEKMHKDLLFKADENERNKPKPMDEDPKPPPPPPPEPMDTSQSDTPQDASRSDTPMPQQQEMGTQASSSRDPLMTRQVSSQSQTSQTSQTQTQDAGTQTRYVPPVIRYTRPQRITLRTHTLIPVPPTPMPLPTYEPSANSQYIRGADRRGWLQPRREPYPPEDRAMPRERQRAVPMDIVPMVPYVDMVPQQARDEFRADTSRLRQRATARESRRRS